MNNNTDDLRTEVKVISQGDHHDSGRATLEIRGDLVAISFIKRHRIASEFYSLHGATIRHKRRIPARRFIAFIGVALIFLLLGVSSSMFIGGDTGLLFAVPLIVVSVALLLVSPFTLFFTLHTAQLFLHGPEEVRKIIVNYRPGKNEILESIFTRFTSLETKKPIHYPSPRVRINSDWLGAYPLRFVGIWTLFTYGCLYTAANTYFSGDDEPLKLPGWTAWLLLLPLVLILAYTAFRMIQAKGHWGQRLERRAAIHAFGKGDFVAGERALIQILSEVPNDVAARSLLAHLCIASGDYGAASGCLAQLPADAEDTRREFEAWIDLVSDMED